MTLTAKQEKFAQCIADGYYVYALCHPTTGQRFYVGKGKGDRALHHVRDCRSGKIYNGAKHNVISEILKSGLEPVIHIIADGLSESDAYRLEWLEIEAGKDELTNIVHGSASRSEKWQAVSNKLLEEIGEFEDWFARGGPEMLAIYEKSYGGPKAFHAMLVDAAKSIAR
jgi:hypothetical protein